MKMQNFWGRRFLALIIDAITITLVLWVISAVIYPLIAATNIFTVLNYWLVLAAFIIVGYFTYMEGKDGATLGKIMMKLKVNAADGDMNYKKAFLRNLSKILWIPLVLDVILGFIFGDSNDRFLDRVSNTVVFKVED
ncbi:RDD family protein [Methanobacterium paludis]|uniref:RDD domain containing protein n=1 Tax=Methanobacterium paludis (strain DSM 25820 / JCM 18151 / SWAN1) TaxID=868131 RepID=F6D4N1_METPW|nr:RDD family protein [Methanobacterium paludis]AEG17516.1 RDD domain containing protein [Methanobacterium paludis]